MGARTAGRLGSVYRLVYRSRSVIPADRRAAELEDILDVAGARNADGGVTGALLVWDDVFVQVLEGDESVVRPLYRAIASDARHCDVVLLDADSAPYRVFGEWSMARVGDHDGADIPLVLERDADGLVPAVTGSGDTMRDAMLDLMREYARDDVEPVGGTLGR